MKNRNSSNNVSICLILLLGIGCLLANHPLPASASALPVPANTTSMLSVNSLLPTSFTLAFMSNRDGNWEIYQMDADGSHQTRLTNTTDIDEQTPRFSLNGLYIAYRWKTISSGISDVASMLFNGSLPTRLTNDAPSDSYMSWSPDNTKIVFASDRDGDFEIYSINADGSGLTNLTNNTTYDSMPEYRPDGLKIVYSCEAGGYNQICLMDPDGSNQVNISNTTLDEIFPSWSPDGAKILYSSYSSTGFGEIYVMNADGSGKTNLSNNSADDWAAVFSPDGLWIAFSSYRDGNDEVYLMRADGSEQTNLSNNAAHDRYPSWRRMISQLFLPSLFK